MSISRSMRTRALRYGVAGAILATIAVGVAAEAEADPVLEWTRQFGTTQNDGARGVATDTAGNVYVAGYTVGSLGGANPGESDAWIAKYDAAGTLQWKRQRNKKGNDYATDVATDADGNVYLTGYTDGSLGGLNLRRTFDLWVAKYDAAGNLQWTRQLVSEGYQIAYGVATDAAGNVYLTGETNRSLGDPEIGRRDAWVIKYDPAGILQWTRQLGTKEVDVAYGVATDAAGNVYLTGYTDGSLVGPNRGEFDAWIAKYDTAGTPQWTRQLGSEYYDSALAVATDAAGNVYLTGFSPDYASRLAGVA